jgi:uncharacterized protein (TIGR02145 family)
MLVVDGHYRNEVTGKASNTAIKMKAITDVTARKTANVNLLTHLEFERVYHLVTKEKMKVWAAKRQAQAEILNLFHIDTTGLKGFSSAEDLDVFGKTDADAALLAISILLQGDRTEAELVALLSEISNDIAEDGLWNGSVDNNADSVKAAIADWIFNQDYSRFRKNVASWKLSNSIGYYEKYLESFMSEEYGISCDDSSERTKQTVSNQMSANDGKAVVCHDGRFFVERPVLLPINEEVPYGKLYDSRDRQIYRTVQIGDYTVMAENLDYVDSSTYKVVSERSWCYEDSAKYCARYGRLYTWSAAMDSAAALTANGAGCSVGPKISCLPIYPVRGICPEGWHLPDSSELALLFDVKNAYSSDFAEKYKSTTGWNNNGNGTDEYGFAVFPTGYGYLNNGSENYAQNGWEAYIWSSSLNAERAVYADFYATREAINMFTQYSPTYAYSIRCFKDSELMP